MCESENEAHKVAWIAEACRVQGYRQRNSLHVTILAKGLRIGRYPGGGRHKRTAVLSLRCGPAEGQRMDGRVPGWADALGQQLSMLRARQRARDRSRWTSGLKVRGPTEGGARRKLVLDPHVQATWLSAQRYCGGWRRGGRVRAGRTKSGDRCLQADKANGWGRRLKRRRQGLRKHAESR